MATFKAILADWCNAGFDPFAAPEETGSTWAGTKNGDNLEAIERSRVATKRMPGTGRRFAAARRPAGQPRLRRRGAGRAGDRGRARLREASSTRFNLFKYLSRSDVTWNPVRHLRVPRIAVLPDHRGVHPPDHPRQRPRRVVHPALRRDRVGRLRQGDRQAARPRADEGRRRGRDAGGHPPPGLRDQALDAARVGERDGWTCPSSTRAGS